MMESKSIKITRRKKKTDTSDESQAQQQQQTTGSIERDTQCSTINLTANKSATDLSAINRAGTASFDSSINLSSCTTGQIPFNKLTTNLSVAPAASTTATVNTQQMGKATVAQTQSKRSVNELLDFFNSEPKKMVKSKLSSIQESNHTVLSPRPAIDNQHARQPASNNFNKFLKAKINYNDLTNDFPEPESQNDSVIYESNNKTIESLHNMSSTTMSTRKRINLNHSKSTTKSTVSKSSTKKPTRTKTTTKGQKNLDSLLAASISTTQDNINHSIKPDNKRAQSPSNAGSDNDEVDIGKFEIKGSTPILRKSVRNFALDKSLSKVNNETPKSKPQSKEIPSSSSKENQKSQVPILAKDEAIKDTALKEDSPKEIIVCKKAYQIIEKLGSGGSCSVFNIRCKASKKHFALKVVDLAKHDSTIIDGFKEEINTLKSLKDCKRVVRFFDHEFRSTKLLIVMEKGDLTFETQVKEARDEKGQLEPLDIRYFWKEMLRCVEEIHSRGIVHSDLKPANFIIVRGRMKLIDFGISKQIETDHTSIFNTNIIGSVDFMAPETVTKTELAGKRGVKYNQKADIWSLGIILYYLVYNKTPFEEFNRAIKFLSIKDGIVNCPPHDNKEVIDLLKFVLQKEPMKRPTCEALLRHPFCR